MRTIPEGVMLRNDVFIILMGVMLKMNAIVIRHARVKRMKPSVSAAWKSMVTTSRTRKMTKGGRTHKCFLCITPRISMELASPTHGAAELL